VITGGIWLLDALFLKRSRAPGDREPMLVEYAKELFSGHPGRIWIAFLPGRAIQDPVRVDDADAVGSAISFWSTNTPTVSACR